MNDTGFIAVTSKEAASAFLRERGITPTRPRASIAQVLFACPQHLSADQVGAALADSGASVSKATIYNTLGLFAQQGLIREVLVDPERVYYDSNTVPHGHLYDAANGRLEDIESGEFPLATLPPLPSGTTVEGVDVVVRIRRG